MIMEWLKKAPKGVTIAVILVCGVLAVAVLAAYVVLSINGVDTTEFRQWVVTVGQLLVYPLLGTTAVASVAAARSASAAEDNSNGRLTERDARIADLEGQMRRNGIQPAPPKDPA
jgi:hypothetical protein